jgi:hypothetical protein
LTVGITGNAIPIAGCGAADAQRVGRARANHGMSGQRMIQPRDCCGPTANAYDRASARHHGQRIPCLDKPARGTPANAIPGSACGSRRGGSAIAGSALGRHRGETHPTAIAPSSAEKERPRTLSQAAPSGANMAGRSARPSGVVPPNQRMQPDAVPASEIVPIFCGIINPNAIPIAGCGAADAQTVGRARATHAMERQRPIQPRDCCGPTANLRESGIRAPSQGTHPVPGQVIAGNARRRHPRARIRPPSWWERHCRERLRT